MLPSSRRQQQPQQPLQPLQSLPPTPTTLSPGGGRGGGPRRPPLPSPHSASLSLSGRGSAGLRSIGGASSDDDDDDDDDEEAAALRERRQQFMAASLLQSQAAAAAAAVPPAVQGYLLFEQTVLLQQAPGRVPFLDEERHRQRFLPPRPADTPVTWRLKERMKVRRRDWNGIGLDAGV